MAALTGNKIKDSYLGLLKSIDNLAFVPRAAGTFVQISDGGGNGLPLYMAVNAIRFHNAYTFPSSDGTGGQVLSTDGAGNLSFSESSDNQTLQEVLTAGNTTTTSIESSADITTNTKFNGDIDGALLQQVKAAEVLVKGDVVYISGGTGDNPEVSKAKADSATTMAALGIIKNNIALNDIGECITSGELTGLGTLLGSFSTGDDLYISATTAGALVNTAPTGVTNLIQKIGKVIKGGNGGALTVLGAFRVNALPNLPTGVIVGNGTSAVSASSNLLIASDGTITLYQPNNVPSDIKNYNIGGGNIALNTDGFNTGFGEDNLSQVGFTGDDNSAFGYKASFSMTTGRENTSFGSSALYTETTGRGNIAIGYHSMYNALNVYYSTVIGYESLYSNTTGTQNVALGYQSLYTNLVGDGNTALGYKSLQINTGDKNIAIGYSSGNLITSGTNNVILGSFSGYRAVGVGGILEYDIRTTSNNIVISDGAGTVYQSFDSTGKARLHNYGGGTFTGTLAKTLGVDSTGDIIEVDAATGDVNVSGTPVANQVAIWTNATTIKGETGLIYTAGRLELNKIEVKGVSPKLSINASTSGDPILDFQDSGNTKAELFYDTVFDEEKFVIRAYAVDTVFERATDTPTLTIDGSNGNIKFNSYGSASPHTGTLAKTLGVDASGNVIEFTAATGDVSISGTPVANQIAIWTDASTIKGDATFVIDSSGGITLYQPYGASSLDNYFIGGGAVGTNQGSNNTGIGHNVLASQGSGNDNCAIGAYTLDALTSGDSNVAIGTAAMGSSVDISWNTAIGSSALKNATGDRNVGVGHTALSDSFFSGTGNTAIGYNSGNAITTGSKNVIIGSFTGFRAAATGVTEYSIITSSNNIVLSDGDGNVRQVIDSSGNVGIGTNSPTARLSVSKTSFSTTFTSADSYIRIGGLENAINGYQFIGFGYNNGSSDLVPAYIGYQQTGTPGNYSKGDLVFGTRNVTTNTAPTERLRISSGGNVGIGNTNPSANAVGDDGKNLVVGNNANVNHSSAISIISGATAGYSYLLFGDGDGAAGYQGQVRYSNEYNSLQFVTSQTPKLTITSGGDVGIGTDNPSGGVGTTSTGTLLDVYDGTVIGGNGGALVLSGLGNSSRKLNLGQIRTILTNGGVGVETSDMTFSTMSAATLTERLRITSGGNVLFGTTGTPNGTSVYGSAFIKTSVERMLLLMASDTTSTATLQTYYNPNGAVGSIKTNGSATSFNTSSDYRLKENVTPITDALSRVNQLKPSRFNFIADANKIVDGFIAHEVQSVIPEAISGEKDAMMDEEFELTPMVEAVTDEEGNVVTEAVEAVMETRSVPDYQGIDQSKIVPLLTAAIQEQQTIIGDLKARIETLEG